MAGRSLWSADLPEIVGVCDDEDSLRKPIFSQAGDSCIVKQTPMQSWVEHVPPARQSTTVTVDLEVPQPFQNSEFDLMQMLAASESHGHQFLNRTAVMELLALQEIEVPAASQSTTVTVDLEVPQPFQNSEFYPMQMLAASESHGHQFLNRTAEMELLALQEIEVPAASQSTTVTVDLEVPQPFQNSEFYPMQMLAASESHGHQFLNRTAVMELLALQEIEVPAASQSTTVTVDLEVPQPFQNSEFYPMQMLAASESHGHQFLNGNAEMEMLALQEIEGFSQDWGSFGKTLVDETPWFPGVATSTEADENPARDSQPSLEDLLMRRQQPLKGIKAVAREKGKRLLTSRTKGQKGKAALKPGKKVKDFVIEDKGTENNALPRETSPGQPRH